MEDWKSEIKSFRYLQKNIKISSDFNALIMFTLFLSDAAKTVFISLQAFLQFLLKKPLRLAGCEAVKYDEVWSRDRAGPPNQPLMSRLDPGAREQSRVTNKVTSSEKEASSNTWNKRNRCSTSSLIPIMFSKSGNTDVGLLNTPFKEYNLPVTAIMLLLLCMPLLILLKYCNIYGSHFCDKAYTRSWSLQTITS